MVVYASRWLILFVFSYLSLMQCLVWGIFSQVPVPAGRYFGWSGSSGDNCTGECNRITTTLLNWGAITFLVFFPFVAWLLLRPNGLQKTVRLGVVLTTLSVLLHCLPSLLFPELHQRQANSTIVLVCLHIASILNAATGPCAMAPPSQLSEVWFPESQRTLATGIATAAPSFGAMLGFWMGPAIVTSASHIPTLMYIQAGMTLPITVIALIYFPDRPPTPPNSSAQPLPSTAGGIQHAASGTEDENATLLHHLTPAPPPSLLSTAKLYLQDLFVVCKSRSLFLLVVSAGLMQGVISAWSGVLEQILDPVLSPIHGEHSAQVLVGYMGVAQNLACCAGSFAIGPLGEALFKRKFKSAIIILYLLIFTGMLLNALMLPLFKAGTPIQTPSSALAWWLGGIIALGGLFQGAQAPLFYELAAEMSHPLPPSITAGVIVFLYNVSSLVVFTLVSLTSESTVTFVSAVGIFLCLLLVIPIREEYLRLDSEHTD